MVAAALNSSIQCLAVNLALNMGCFLDADALEIFAKMPGSASRVRSRAMQTCQVQGLAML